jgi:RNA recognition motif-containing protein
VPPVRLFIGNLPYQATEDDLRTHFSAVGEPTQIVRPLDRETGRARGFAFVEYAERAVAEEAISRFDGQLFMGRPLAVSEARARDDRGPGGPPRPGMGGPPRPGGGYPPRPGGGSGYPPRPGGFGGPGGPPRAGGFPPRPGGPGGPGAGGPPGDKFGPPAPPRNKKGAKGGFRKEEQKPRGPIPTKFTGRMYDLDDVSEEDAVDELPDFMKPDDVEPSDDEAATTPDEAGTEPDDDPDRDDE